MSWREKLVDVVLGAKSTVSLEERARTLGKAADEAELRAKAAETEYELKKRIASAEETRREALRKAKALSKWSTQKLLKWLALIVILVVSMMALRSCGGC